MKKLALVFMFVVLNSCIEDQGVDCNTLQCKSSFGDFELQELLPFEDDYPKEVKGETWLDNGYEDLLWYKNPDKMPTNLSDAITRCDKLVVGNNSNWRLPKIDEMQYLINNCSGMTKYTCELDEYPINQCSPCERDGFHYLSPKFETEFYKYEFWSSSVNFEDGLVFTLDLSEKADQKMVKLSESDHTYLSVICTSDI